MIIGCPSYPDIGSQFFSVSRAKATTMLDSLVVSVSGWAINLSFVNGEYPMKNTSLPVHTKVPGAGKLQHPLVFIVSPHRSWSHYERPPRIQVLDVSCFHADVHKCFGDSHDCTMRTTFDPGIRYRFVGYYRHRPGVCYYIHKPSHAYY
ncbi:hypothetical protein GY45DRAFT_1140817 [Cubamyces sp. BRFM 1775]|nr:hypothetical protein GY45DRAFT_1140817 [Cubamyces sp. BRFM 1775]